MRLKTGAAVVEDRVERKVRSWQKHGGHKHHHPQQRLPTAAETKLHKTVAEFLDWALIPPAMWTTFPAGGYLLEAKSASQLKARGLKPGMPDLQIFPGNGKVIMIELKVGPGRLTPVQYDMIDKLKRAGIACYVCYDSLANVIQVLKAHDVPLRKISVAA